MTQQMNFSREEQKLLDRHPRLLAEWLVETDGVKNQCLQDIRRYFGLKKFGMLEQLREDVKATEKRAEWETANRQAKRAQAGAIAKAPQNDPERWKQVQVLAATNPRYRYLLETEVQR